MRNMEKLYDVVIVGTGAAGLYCALNLPSRIRTLVISKEKADESDSFLARMIMNLTLPIPCAPAILKMTKKLWI